MYTTYMVRSLGALTVFGHDHPQTVNLFILTYIGIITIWRNEACAFMIQVQRTAQTIQINTPCANSCVFTFASGSGWP